MLSIESPLILFCAIIAVFLFMFSVALLLRFTYELVK